MKAVIVDDESYIVHYLLNMFAWEDFGFREVYPSTNPQQVKDMIEREKIDLLISDIRMPEISGLDLLRYISQEKQNTKVLLLSGYSEFEYAREAIRYGASDYLLKPIMKEELGEAISAILTELNMDNSTELSHASDENWGGITKAEDEIQTDCINYEQGQSSKIMGTIQEYIKQHLSSDLSLAELSDVVHLHPVYLSRLYKQETGEKISTYIVNTRMNKAAELLIQTDLRVADITKEVGYHKIQYFIQLFKNQFGETPQQYRRKFSGYH